MIAYSFLTLLPPGVRLAKTCWHVWNFNLPDDEDYSQFPFNRITRFHRVRKLRLMEVNGHHFLHCSCGFYHRTGVPCPHFFFVFPHIEIEMFHVRCWKSYNAHYGDDDELGDALRIAQKQHFDNEKNGIPVPKRIIDLSCVLNDEGAVYPLKLRTTNDNDCSKAKFVLSKKCCTYDDLKYMR
jgi:hypothetical protein